MACVVAEGPNSRVIRQSVLIKMDKAQLIHCGRGYGLPWERDDERVLADVLVEHISIKQAFDQYGVAIDPCTLTVH